MAPPRRPPPYPRRGGGLIYDLDVTVLCSKGHEGEEVGIGDGDRCADVRVGCKVCAEACKGGVKLERGWGAHGDEVLVMMVSTAAADGNGDK